MEGEREPPSPLLWPPRTPQRTASFPSYPSPPGIRPWLLVLLSSVFILLFLPSFLSSSSSSSLPAFRPGGLVKNGWDAFNLLLVLFAILCGILSRNNSPADGSPHRPQSHDWPAYSHDPATPTDAVANAPVPVRRMRSSRSYPDLRQEAAEWDGWRFSDDIQLYRSPRSKRPMQEVSSEESVVKTIPVDTSGVRINNPLRSRSPPPTPPPPPPLPPPRQPRRTAQKPPEREVEQDAKSEEENTRSPLPTPSAHHPPPPPPPPPPELKRGHQRKKSGGGAKDIAGALSLFYQKKRKKGSSTNKMAHEDILPPGAYASPSPPPPPPPPPPTHPPSSVFNKLFSHKKGGSKVRKIHSISAHPASPPPPPPPPPPPQRTQKQAPHPPQRSPTPPHRLQHKKREVSSLPKSSVPPSFPVPPVTATSDSRRSASEGEMVTGQGTEGVGREEGTVLCPSPDVNNKADMFIARFRAGLQLEKLNSFKAKHRRPEQHIEEEEEEVMMIGDLFD